MPNKARYEANKEKVKAEALAWARANRERRKEIQRAYRERNPGADQESGRKWREKNRDRHRAKNRAWYLANRERWAAYKQNRRARERRFEGKLSPRLREVLHARQGGLCPGCGKILRKGRMHLDHIVPLVRGGRHADANIQLLCAPCNLSKNDKTMAEFMEWRGGGR